MELYSQAIQCKYNQPIYIYPIGDIQYQGKDGPTEMGHLRRHIKEGADRGAYFVGLGDYIDFASPSNRQRLKGAALYDSAEDVLDKTAIDLVDELYKEALAPMKGRTIGLLHGHHYYHLRTGKTSDQYLCELLDTRFLGTCAYVRLQLFTTESANISLTLWLHHGAGGGMKSYAPVCKLENTVANWDADIFLMSHTAKQATSVVNRVEAYWHSRGGGFLRHREIRLVGTGGSSGAYQAFAKQGLVPMDGYVGQKMLNPAAIGSPIIKITPVRKNDYKSGKRIRTMELDIKVEM